MCIIAHNWWRSEVRDYTVVMDNEGMIGTRFVGW